MTAVNDANSVHYFRSNDIKASLKTSNTRTRLNILRTKHTHAGKTSYSVKTELSKKRIFFLPLSRFRLLINRLMARNT